MIARTTTTPPGPGPLSRPLRVADVPAAGLDVTVEADAAERAALAADFGLVAIGALAGTFRVERRGDSAEVRGRVAARVTQTCVVTLEPFEAEVAEPVELRFADLPEAALDGGEPRVVEVAEEDAPDPIVSGRIDLGALTAEFLALGLDPYPRKPGVAFDAPGETRESPFAALGRLRPGGDG